VWFSAGRAIQTPVYRSDRLVPGPVVPGPALVETTDTTVAVPPGFGLSADPWRNLILEATVE
jgi:N-methylhydantoinase A/oxoprolinase/acetone carboxylase beta subunit